ncbi:MAG: hypothetical protein QXD77_02100 [Candidatus Aenigmatarchaeota archaeon]
MRYITETAELEMAEFFMDDARHEARKSVCRKSQRGAVLAKGNALLGKGHNLVTHGELCDPCVRADIHDNSRVELCSALHAEQMAVLDAHGKKTPLRGARMYQAELRKGKVMYSGEPSCTVCSRLLYAAGIEMVLWRPNGFAVYAPEELNRLSFEYVLRKR